MLLSDVAAADDVAFDGDAVVFVGGSGVVPVDGANGANGDDVAFCQL